MKFYYEGQLIRTSKSHNYTHACINKNKGEDGKYQVYGCSTSRAGAEKVKQKELSWYANNIDSCNRALKAIEEGKSGYYSKRNGFVSFKIYDGLSTKEKAEAAKKEAERIYNAISENWIIVEVTEEA